ncbi:MAG: tellurite resistance protein TerC [Blastocatellia bacterium]|jgi:tellurite resistance protein TerC|nr:tellurite resistance protein TerC [Blastocatellia bacterium]
MHILTNSVLAWGGFCAFILIMLAIDLGLFNRKSHSPSYKEATIWSAVWVTLALIFSGLIFAREGHQKGLEFLTGYLIELSLSVDNLFVFLLIFSYFRVPTKYQHRVLYWGVVGALVMRISMIVVGTELIDRFHWVIYIFGAFLVYTGVKMFREEETELEPEDNPVVRLVTRYIPITRHYEGRKFFTRSEGKRVGTLLLLVLITVEITDLIFALDSIPAIFGVTTDRFIIYTSNVFAILGLRTFYFLLAGVVEKFHYLKLGIGMVLTLIGFKMLISSFWNVPTSLALGAVGLILVSSVLASLIWPKPPTPPNQIEGGAEDTAPEVETATNLEGEETTPVSPASR